MTRSGIASRITRAGCVLLAAACADGGPVGVESPTTPPSPALFGGNGLVRCAPMASSSATAVVGPEGGTLNVGPHALSIPAGALTQPVSLTAVAPSGSVNRVEFSPEGLTFDQPAWLTMSYANCGLLAALVSKRIAYVDPGAGLDLFTVVEMLASTDDLLNRRITGSLSHFSSYAIAW